MKECSKRVFSVMIALFLVACVIDSENGEKEHKSEHSIHGEKIVTINEKTFYEDDLAFYTLMNQVLLEIHYTATDDEGERAYYEEQQTFYENRNVQLQSLIEIYAMSLLAEEKNYFVPDEKLRNAVLTFNETVEESEVALHTIEQFGREQYNRELEEYIRQTMLRDRIAQELKKEIQEENPNAANDEINYLLDERFQDLYREQMSTLEMEIHLK